MTELKAKRCETCGLHDNCPYSGLCPMLQAQATLAVLERGESIDIGGWGVRDLRRVTHSGAAQEETD